MTQQSRRSARTPLTSHGTAVQSLASAWLDVLADAPEVRAAGGDLACSPAGLWLALTAAASGASGATAQELRALLGAAGEEAAAAVRQAAEGLAATSALATALGLWARAPVHRAFREALPSLHLGGLAPEDLSRVDAWVREATGGLIERLPLRPAPEALLVLASAVALTARWDWPFDAADTRPRPFTDAAGRRHQVPTMTKAVSPADVWHVLPAGRDAGGGARPARRRLGRLWRRAGEPRADHPGAGDKAVTVVQLGCRAEGAGALPAVVRFVLGPPGAPPGQVLPAAWAPVDRRVAVDADQVSVALPRLHLRTRLEVLPQLERLGVRRAASDDAQFPALSPTPLRISQVVQECRVTVAEQGVTAAAVSAVEYLLAGAAVQPSRPLHLAFDRPFGLVVLDGGGTVPLFAAWQARAPRDPEG